MSYCFPTNLSVDAIQHELSELQIAFDPSQLSKPTYEVVRNYYEQAVLALLDVTREEIMQPYLAASDGLEHPELHDESIPVVNAFSMVTKLMIMCGVNDFSIAVDLFRPDPTRLRRHLCAIINFAKFREEKVDMLATAEERVKEKEIEVQALRDEREQMLAEIQRLKDHHAAREREAAAIHAETAAIASKNMQLNKIHNVLSEEIRSYKTQSNQLTDQATAAKLELSSLKREMEELEDQIVSSPDRLQRAIAETAAAAQNQREYYAALRSTFNDLERQLEMVGKFERDLQRCIKILEDLEEAIARKKEVSAATKDTKEAIAKEERRLNELVSKNTAARRQLMSLQDKLNRIEQQSQLKVVAATALLEDQVKRKEKAEAEHAAGGARQAEQEAQVRIWRERAADVRAAKDAKVKDLVDKFNQLRRGVTEYNRRLEAAMAANADLPTIYAEAARSPWDGIGDGGTLHGPDAVQGRDAATERGATLLSAGVQRMTLV